jgi:hypothetical protein
MRANLATVFGILLIVVGAVGLVMKGITYTREKKVLDIGPIEATADQQERIPIPAWAAGVILAAGVVIVVAGSRSKA